MGKRCALIDMDDDKSDLYKWAIQSELLSEHVYQFSSPHYKEFCSFISNLKDSYEYIIIDTPPRPTSISPYSHIFALKQSNLALISVFGGKMEENEYYKVRDICDMESIPYRILFSRWNESYKMNQLVKDNLKNEPKLVSSINQSIKYVEAEAYGVHILESKISMDEEQQLYGLAREIISTLEEI